MFRRAPGERHNRKRRILVWIGDEGSAVGDEKIFYVVGLAISIEYGSFWIGAHACGADFVNDFSAGLNAEGIRTIDLGFGAVLAAGGLDDCAKGLLHVLCLAEFVVAPLEME